MDQPLDAGISAVAALEEPTRRLLYEHVARQPEPVTRDEAAAACELPRATAAFHLDRLAEEGLLDVVFQRRTGRSGPGAGRPAKLYRRSSQQVTVSLPERRYELAGRLLAAAVEDTERTGDAAQGALERRARELGAAIGADAVAAHDAPTGTDRVLRVLDGHGFEPRATTDAEIVLGNCPFHRLATEHTEVVCGMNLSLVTGILAGLGATELRAELAPARGLCCVRIASR